MSLLPAADGDGGLRAWAIFFSAVGGEYDLSELGQKHEKTDFGKGAYTFTTSRFMDKRRIGAHYRTARKNFFEGKEQKFGTLTIKQ